MSSDKERKTAVASPRPFQVTINLLSNALKSDSLRDDIVDPETSIGDLDAFSTPPASQDAPEIQDGNELGILEDPEDLSEEEHDKLETKQSSAANSIKPPPLATQDWDERVLFNPKFSDWKELDFSNEDVKLDIQSFVRSFGRAVDATVGSPAFLLKGKLDSLPANRGFTRWVDSSGHYRPNLITLNQGNCVCWAPQRWTKVDLSRSKHYTGFPSMEKNRPDFARINLFNGLCVWVAKEHLPKWSEMAFVVVYGNRDMTHHNMGVMANFNPEFLDKVAKVVPARSEAALVELSLLVAEQRKEEPILSFYRYPAKWISDLNVPASVKLHLLRMQNIPRNLFPKVTGIEDSHLIIFGLQSVVNDGGEHAERAKYCLDRLSAATDAARSNVAAKVRQAFDDLQNRRPDLSALGTQWESDPEENLDREVMFDFEGQRYSADIQHLRNFREVLDGFRPFFLNGSERLNSLLEFSSQESEKLHAGIIRMEVSLPSSCLSPVTKSGKESQGFNRRGHFWREKLNIELRYQGPWFFGDSDMANCLNNQIIAEVACNGLPMHAVLIPKLQILKSEVKVPKYLDSFSFDERGFVQKGLLNEKQLSESEEILQSGVFRLFEPDVRDLILSNPERVRLMNGQEYFSQNAPIQLELHDLKGPGKVEFVPQEGDVLNVAPPASAKDWLFSMRKRSKGVGLLTPRNDPEDLPPLPFDNESEAETHRSDAKSNHSHGGSEKKPSVKQGLIQPQREKFRVGNWLSEEVLKLPVTVRMYVMSRALDKLANPDSGEGISSKWSETLLRYMPRPHFGKPLTGGHNYYIDAAGHKFPDFFKEGKENLPHSGLSMTEIPNIPIPDREARIVRFGRTGKASVLFH